MKPIKNVTEITNRKSKELTAIELAFAEAQKKKVEGEKQQHVVIKTIADKEPTSEINKQKKDKTTSFNCGISEENDNFLNTRKSMLIQDCLILHREKIQRNNTAPNQTCPKIKKTDPPRVALTIKSDEIKTKKIKENAIVNKVAWKSQVYDGVPNKESDIVVGFDFGTSSSKLVIRDSVRETAYAIPFGQYSCSGNPYLLPTRLFINKDGTVSFLSGDYECKDLKIRLMDDPWKIIYNIPKVSKSLSAMEIVAAYIALTIQHARQWFLDKTKLIYKDTKIHWHLNLGMPSKNYDDKGYQDNFRSVALAGWYQSRLDVPIKILNISGCIKLAMELIKTNNEQMIDCDPNSFWLHPDYVNTHPEVIMEVVGYVRSPLRTSGLHLLVDIGATTLDSAAFIIHDKDGDNIFPLLKTKVEKYGTMRLHKHRMKGLKLQIESLFKEKYHIDPSMRLPDTNHYEIEVKENEVDQIDSEFFRECRKIIGEVLKETKSYRDPYSKAWKNGLPVFLCGGGGRVKQYKDMLERLSNNIAQSQVDFGGIELKEIPKPDQLEAPELFHGDYDRLAVAYGLSFTSFEIGKVMPERGIVDVTPRRQALDLENRYVDKDMC